MLSIPPSVKLWFAGGVDLRLGFDGLAGLVRTQLSADPPGLPELPPRRVRPDHLRCHRPRGRDRRGGRVAATPDDQRLRQVAGRGGRTVGQSCE